MEIKQKRIFSPEHKEKIRLAHVGKISPLRGKKTGRIPWNKNVHGWMTEEHKEQIIKSRIGTKHSEKTKRKMSISQKGKTAGEKHYNWKGDKCTYRSLHEWVQNLKGAPNKCENCGKSEENKRNMHWSNISGKYKRDLSDYKRLCMLCHRKNDRRHSGFKEHFNKDKTRKLIN